ncbi:MAG: hypothetical protein ACLVH3_06375 [Blautia obeum]
MMIRMIPHGQSFYIQSMSGDSEVGNSIFQMDGGTITSKNGGFILHN